MPPYVSKPHKLLLIAAVLGILIIGLPVWALLSYIWSPTGEVWDHLLPNLLSNYFINSLLISSGVALVSFILGIGCAWLCGVCDFPGRSWYQWMLILPLAYPTYIIAYTYTGILDYGGSLYMLGKTYLGIETPVPIRSMGGAITVIAFTLYPYIYLLARTSWAHKSGTLINAGRILGASPWEVFTKIALPINRPVIAAGIAIVVMETLADYGTVQYFGVNTFSIGIIRTWFGLDSLAGAAQLSMILLFFTLTLMVVERKMRKHTRYSMGNQPNPGPAYVLHGKKAIAANLFCITPILLGFVIPSLQLLWWLFSQIDSIVWQEYFILASGTLGLAVLSAIIIVAAATLLSYAKRFYPNKIFHFVAQIASCGYAIPGVVIAVGALGASMFIQDLSGILLSGGFIILILGYTTRFLTLGINTMDTALEKVPHSMDFTARTLRASWPRILGKIHLPIIKASLLTAILFILVDIIKELPATLVLRPFNFNTLAIKTYELAIDERLADIALPALSIVVIGLFPIIILAKSMDAQNR